MTTELGAIGQSVDSNQTFAIVIAEGMLKWRLDFWLIEQTTLKFDAELKKHSLQYASIFFISNAVRYLSCFSVYLLCCIFLLLTLSSGELIVQGAYYSAIYVAECFLEISCRFHYVILLLLLLFIADL